MYEYDKRVVLTLDAGGTNFVFSAIQGNNEMISPIGLPAVSDNLDECLEVLVKGFDRVIAAIPVPPVAISFAFPGPADYENGIIGDLPNFPSFRGGVALGPFLKHKYGIPVFIENDGNLFAYGEALSGALPMINRELSLAGCSREYKNLIGITLGTGFGAGVVINKVLLTGDNGCGGDIWLMRNKKYPDMLAEESVSIRAVRRVYSDLSGQSSASLSPKDIYDIAEGIKEGDSHAAIASFNELGIMAGAAIASVLNVVDGLVVIGGGVAGASKYILPALITELRAQLTTFSGNKFPCVSMQVYNGEDESERARFLSLSDSQVVIPGTHLTTTYHQLKQTLVLCSKEGASRSIMRGAYAYALQKICLLYTSPSPRD